MAITWPNIWMKVTQNYLSKKQNIKKKKKCAWFHSSSAALRLNLSVWRRQEHRGKALVRTEKCGGVSTHSGACTEVLVWRLAASWFLSASSYPNGFLQDPPVASTLRTWCCLADRQTSVVRVTARIRACSAWPQSSMLSVGDDTPNASQEKWIWRK